MRRAGALALLLVAAGCDTGFRPVTLVENLRLLAVRAEPPDLKPGDTARVQALVPDPSRPTPGSVLWLGCAPDPYDLNRSPCADTALLQDPSALTGGTGRLPPGVSIIGLNELAAYSAAADVFKELPAGDERRVKGTVGQMLAFAVAETVSPDATVGQLQALFERVQRKEVRSILGLFRVRISEAPERNVNPTVTALRVGDEVVPPGVTVAMLPGAQAKLDLDADPSVFEPYTVTLPTGPEARTERVLAAWYSTFGRFDQERTTLNEEVKTTLSAPGGVDLTDKVPERRAGALWVVLRDTRGGVGWYEWPLFVCDAALPEPRVTQVDWPAAASGDVVLRGDNLGSVLEVLVDGRPLTQGAWSPTVGTWAGKLPAGVVPGVVRGEVRAKTCGRAPLK